MLSVVIHVRPAELILRGVGLTRVEVELADLAVQTFLLLYLCGNLIWWLSSSHNALLCFFVRILRWHRFSLDWVICREFLHWLLLLRYEKGSHGPFNETSLTPRLFFSWIWRQIIVYCLDFRFLFHLNLSEFSWRVADNGMGCGFALRVVFVQVMPVKVTGG